MDAIDFKLMQQLQNQADIPLAELSRRAGISKTTCWNRLQRMEEQGVMVGKFTHFNRNALGLPVVAFLSLTVGHHTDEWNRQFQEIIEASPEIVEVHRLTGAGADYQLKIVCADIESYDAFQQKLIGLIDFTSMTTQISMKELKYTHRLPLGHIDKG